jgi:hypothetical protein
MGRRGDLVEVLGELQRDQDVMATLDNLVVTSALPVIRTELGASVETLQGSWTPPHARRRGSS